MISVVTCLFGSCSLIRLSTEFADNKLQQHFISSGQKHLLQFFCWAWALYVLISWKKFKLSNSFSLWTVKEKYIYHIKYCVLCQTILCFHYLWWKFVSFRDLCNSSVSALGDCFTKELLQQLSQKVLDKMDEQCEKDTVITVRIQWL